MRMTRAALRAQASEEVLRADIDIQLKRNSFLLDNNELLIHEDSDKENGETHISESDDKIASEENERSALRDITEENYPKASATDMEIREASLKKTKKGKSGKRRKKVETEVQEAEADTVVEATTGPKKEHNTPLENSCSDLNISTTELSEQTELDQSTSTILDESMEAAISDEQNELMVGSEESRSAEHGDQIENVRLQEAEVAPMHVSKSTSLETTQSLTPETPQKPTETSSKTPKFNPSIHLPAETETENSADISDDSFVDAIKTRSPSKVEVSHHDQIDSDTDSFVENILSRTPSKALASPRVEDSVAALDALEDAIEKFSEDLPSVHNMSVESPVKQKKSPVKTMLHDISTPGQSIARTPSKASAKTPTHASQSKLSSKTPQTTKEKPAPKSIVKERVKAFETKPVVVPHRRATSVTIVKLGAAAASKPQSKPKHAPTKSVPTVSALTISNSPIKQEPNIVKKRVVSGPLSTSKPAFVPTKSSKPITKSTFTLPGEAIAAKLKAQREERLKREEVAAEKKAQFKARPVPVKVSRPSVMPRENKASQARMSVMTKGSGENKENVAPVIKPASRPTSTAVTIPKIRSDSAKANSSVRRTTTVGSSTTSAVENNSSTVTSQSQRVTSNTSTASTTSARTALVNSNSNTTSIRGKEVYSRARTNMEAEQREKKEKEEAAKKARAEAAERGRQASREWAEKQKKRQLEKERETSLATEVVA